MKKLTLECVSRQRSKEISVMLGSLLSQSFQEWDLTILEEADSNYLSDRYFVGLCRKLKDEGHIITLLHPKAILGSSVGIIEVMKETKTPYAMKIDDDHFLEKDSLSKMIKTIEDPDIGAVGGMVQIIDRELIPISDIPSDFNRWTGKLKDFWNDYSSMTFSYPEKVVDVDFVRAPFMYKADILHDLGFLETYPTLGYSQRAHRFESEVCNLLSKERSLRTVIHTGAKLWHFMSQTGGNRIRGSEGIKEDDEIYYKRWRDFHLKRGLE